MQKLKTDEIKKYSSLSWIKINDNSKILCININDEALKFLKLMNPSSTFDAYNSKNNYINLSYDYIFAFHIFENNEFKLLNNIYLYLKNEGILYLGSENANAMAYECGDTPAFVHMYDKKYVKDQLIKNNFNIEECFSVLPSLQEIQFVISEKYKINESISIRYVPSNKYNWQRIINEGKCFEKINDLNIFHNKANSYIFMLSKAPINVDSPLQVTLSPNRGSKLFSITSIYKNRVEKTYPFNTNNNLLNNSNYLIDHNINMVEMTLDKNKYVMPFIKNINCLLYFKKLLLTDTDKFIKTCDDYYNLLLNSSNIIKHNNFGPILERCYIDLVPLNCFVINDNFTFFDQEFYIDNYPVNLIMWRSLYMIYNNMEKGIYPSIEEMYIRYGFDAYADILAKMSNDFTSKLRNTNN